MVGCFNLRFGAAALGVMMTSCSGVEPTGRSAQAIVGGVASAEDQNAVVMLVATTDTASAACSGTLVANNLVLTAWHCVAHVAPGAIVCDENGDQTAAGSEPGDDYTPGNILVFRGTRRPVTSADLKRPAARGQQIFHPSGRTLCANDLALLVLDRSVEGAVIAPLRLDGRVAAGEAFTAVGWGVASGSGLPLARQQRGGLTVTRVGPLAQTADESALPASDWETHESVCSGDSGGPALADATGAVIGVVSRGGNREGGGNAAARCSGQTARAVYTGIAPWAELVRRAFDATGQVPWEESRGAAPDQALVAPPAGTEEVAMDVAPPVAVPLPVDDPSTPPLGKNFDERHAPEQTRCAAGAIGAATEAANAIAIAIGIAIAIAARRRAAQPQMAPARVRPKAPGRVR